MKKILLILLISLFFIPNVNADTMTTTVNDAAFNTSDGIAYFPSIYTSTANTQKFWTIDTISNTTHATFKVGNFSGIDKSKTYTISFYVLGGPLFYNYDTEFTQTSLYVNPPIVRVDYSQFCYVRPLGSSYSFAATSSQPTNVYAVVCDNFTFTKDSFDVVINTVPYNIPSSFGISYDFGYVATNQGLQDIVTSNSEIKDSVNDLNDNITDSTDKINDSITSEDGPTNLGALDNSAGWLPAGPIDSILNLPLSLFNSLLIALSSTCQPLQITFPFINFKYNLPCISTIYSRINGLNAIVDFIGLVVGVLILYYYFIHLYNWVDKKLTMQYNDDWGGI